MRLFRDALGLSRDQFGEQYGLSASTLSGYELDKRSPHVDGLLPFIQAGANANWLLTGEGPMLLADLASPAVTEPAPPALVYSQAPAPVSPAAIHEAPSAVRTGPVFDPKLMQQVVDFFYRWQEENKDRVRIGKKAHGALIAVLYKVAATSGAVVREEMEQVLSIAA